MQTCKASITHCQYMQGAMYMNAEYTSSFTSSFQTDASLYSVVMREQILFTSLALCSSACYSI